MAKFLSGVEHVQLLDGHESLRLGTRFETNLAGQDVYASVQEFEPMTRIAWGGGPKASLESKAYHAWIIMPTADGTHLWTEETMQGPLWIELAKQAPDVFWRTHQKLLEDFAKVATRQNGSPTRSDSRHWWRAGAGARPHLDSALIFQDLFKKEQ